MDARGDLIDALRGDSGADLVLAEALELLAAGANTREMRDDGG